MADRLKFARFDCGGDVSLGVVQGDEVVVIDGSPFGTYRETGTRHSLAHVKLLPPVVPTKIVCIGLNYRGHIEEIGARIPERPQFFLKPPSSVIGHGDAIVIPRGAERVDYEGELAVVIRDTLKDIPEEESLDHVLGYCCFNDVTERVLL
jgi:2-keto-4-pentenoate hydratase/2-oxohepta-3-ene-1,7-dioic acid hydratase in catechol pathway